MQLFLNVKKSFSFKSPGSCFNWWGLEQWQPLAVCQPSEATIHNQNTDPEISKTGSLLPTPTPAGYTNIFLFLHLPIMGLGTE